MNEQFKIICAADMKPDIEEAEKEISKQCYIEDDQIIMNVNYEYVIELNRCSTPEEILGWVEHLCSKGWITLKVIRRFVNLASNAHNIAIHPLG